MKSYLFLSSALMLCLFSGALFAKSENSNQSKEGSLCTTSQGEEGMWIKHKGILKCLYLYGLSKKEPKPNVGDPCVTKNRELGEWIESGHQIQCRSVRNNER